ncbi:YraN family protein [Thalassomonas sp. M1454]|uniref:YraN family protein n=1 Tax=Thalassomonas sp. M1454 TaxID=2594477 RepID=UPI0011800B77|nr:YraN family protein [Thalassomonas sp. M1454]TRX52758.1 YraN family protein [Thalassomonas sp. M1454]
MLKWIKPTNRSKGFLFEELAKNYLITNQLEFVESNFYSRFGEIDLIMKDGKTLVFVEVKYRKSDRFGNPSALVSLSKQKKIIKTAKFYLLKKQLNEYNSYFRYDVVSLLGPADNPQITWLKNAFYGV